VIDNKEHDLKQRIIDEMTVDHRNVLEKNLELAKRLVRITRDGKVDLLSRDDLNGKEQILLYLIGKLYAKEAGFVDTAEVGSEELKTELCFPEGSLFPWLKWLREENKIKRVKKGRYSYHIVPENLVEKILKTIGQKIKKNLEE
jgi:hypothetical protein